MDYLDFDLWLESIDDFNCRVRVGHSPAGQAQVEVRLPVDLNSISEFRRKLGLSLAGLETESERMDPRNLGSILYDAIFSGSVRACLDESRGYAQGHSSRGLRIKIHFNSLDKKANLIASLPWEFLFRRETRDFLALERGISLVRYYDIPRAPKPLATDLPLRVGVLISSPIGAVELNLKSELEGISRAASFTSRGIESVVLQDRTVGGLRRQLLKESLHILHFIGHGQYDEVSGVGSLLFENSHRRADMVSGELLGNIVKGIDSLRLVVLNACKTASHAAGETTDSFASVASALVLAGVPAVVAMQFPIDDDAAVEFSSSFYADLARGGVLDTAVTEGRMAIYATSPNSVEWANPVLFMRSPDGKIFDVGKAGAQVELDLGRDHLRARDFRSAERCLRASYSAAPTSTEAGLMLCITLLAEKPLMSLPIELAQEVNQLLCDIVDAGSAEYESPAKLLLGILRFDFFLANKIRAAGIESKILFDDLERRFPSRDEVLMLKPIRRSEAASLLFNLDE